MDATQGSHHGKPPRLPARIRLHGRAVWVLRMPLAWTLCPWIGSEILLRLSTHVRCPWLAPMCFRPHVPSTPSDPSPFPLPGLSPFRTRTPPGSRPGPLPFEPGPFLLCRGRRRARDAVPIDPTFNGRIRETSEPLGRRSSEPSSRPRRRRSTGAWDTTCVLEAPRIADHVPRVRTVGNRRVFRGTGSVLPAACGPRA